MTKTTKTPTGINGVPYAKVTLRAAEVFAASNSGALAYTRRYGWVSKPAPGEPWTMRRAEPITTLAAITALREVGFEGPVGPKRVRSVLNAARQLPELAAPPAAELGHLTPRR